MGTNIQLFLTKGTTSSECTVVPDHIQGLLKEYLRRYDEWKVIQRKEVAWFFIVVLLGLFSLIDFMGVVAVPYWVIICLFGLFLVALRHYKHIKNKSGHAYINFFILHHHLIGKLEVGFCNHTHECQCVENFKKYIWNKYRITFNSVDFY